MGKSWGSFYWQLERKRKYYMSFHSSRATSTVATAVTFALCFLLYVNLWSTATTIMKHPPNNNNNKNTHTVTQQQQHHRDHIPIPPNHQHLQKLEPKYLENAPRPRIHQNQQQQQQKQQQQQQKNKIFYPVKTNGEFSGQAQLVKPGMDNNKSRKDKEDDDNGKEDEAKDDSRQSQKSLKTKEEDEMVKLQRIFKKADLNKDAHLSATELSTWINERVRAHFSTALRDNFDAFFGIDRSPRNGRVEWSEYLEFHLTKKMGYHGPKITPDSVNKRTEEYKKLPKEIKVEIAALEARFSENANNDPDYLTVDEFLAFSHPEASPTKLLSQVSDTFSTFDLDGDGIITKTEFDTTYAEAEGVDNVFKEDLHLIDTDQNGQISRVELMRYMDPKNTLHADKDTNNLLKHLDSNKDQKLTMEELKKDMKFVLESKLFDAAKNLHRNQLLHN